MRTYARWARAAFFVAASLTFLSPRSARATGFAVDRFEPSERGSSWFVLDSLDLRGHARPAVGIVGSYQYRPLVLRNNDEVQSAIVNHVLTTHVGASVNLWSRVRFAVNAPIVLYTEGQQGTIASGTFDPPQDAQQLGDLRLAGDVRLFGEHGGPLTMALGARVWLPTGSPASYTGDGTVRIAPRVLAAGVKGPIAYAANLGIMFRDPKAGDFAGSPLGHELQWAAAVGYRFAEGRGVVGPELFGGTVLSSAFKTRSTPLEVLLGAHYSIVHGLRAGLGIGTGLVSGYGAPEVRMTGGIEWMMDAPKNAGAPPPAPAGETDTDGDGIPDSVDACMDVQGAKTSDPRTNGCADRDGDGLLDPLDACPFEKGPPGSNGCPPAVAPPESDADGDGIPDRLDACPKASGKANPDPRKNGCPKLLVQGDQILVYTDIPADEAAMEQIAAILKDDTSIQKLRIEAHTDNRGDAEANKKASQDRADAIASWLVAHGVDKKRIEATGFGGERPIEANDTDEGRAANRRLELHIER